MSDQPRAEQPDPLARGVRIAAGLILGGVALAVTLIAAGAFDPRPVGPLQASEQPGKRTLPAAGEAAFSQPAPWAGGSVPARFSARLTAALADGETDSAYGLTLTNGDAQLLLAISPAGYLTIRETRDSEPPAYHLPWQTWPHIRSGTQANELWLDVTQTNAGAEVTAWVNRERLWSGATDWTPRDTGLWLGSFGGPVTVDFQSFEWYAAPDAQRYRTDGKKLKSVGIRNQSKMSSCSRPAICG